MTRQKHLLFGLTLLLVSVTCTEIQFTISGSGTRCFGEELASHDLLVVRAKAIDPNPNMLFTLLIKTSVAEGALNAASASVGSVVFKEENKSSITHAFTSMIAGPHWVCVTNMDGYKELTIELSMRTGAKAKDYNQIAKKDHLEPAQLSIRKVNDLLREYRSTLFYQRRREERMRETTDSTSSRALTFCVLNIGIIIGLGLLQAYSLRKFFRSKKII